MTRAQKKRLMLRELAARIAAHLTRFENDSKINKRQRYDVNRGWYDDPNGTRDYYTSGAHVGGRYVAIRYISYQGTSKLTRERAEAYLAWLDAGNVGKHFESERE